MNTNLLLEFFGEDLNNTENNVDRFVNYLISSENALSIFNTLTIFLFQHKLLDTSVPFLYRLIDNVLHHDKALSLPDTFWQYILEIAEDEISPPCEMVQYLNNLKALQEFQN